MKSIAILGGGIGGLCAAIGLQRAGIEVNVYEGAPELQALGAGLVLSVNSVLALRQLGLDEAVQSVGHAFDEVAILDQRGRPISSTDMRSLAVAYGVSNFSIHRADLQEVLVSQLTPHTLQVGKKCVAITQRENQVTLSFEDGSTAVAEALIAFDGIHSVVRRTLLPQVTLRYAGYTCWRSVISYDSHQRISFSETWGKQGRFGIVPLTDQRVYWFATLNAKRNDPHLRSYTVADLQRTFQNYHAPIVDILAHTSDEELLWNDILDFKPIERYAFGNIALAGDAAHAMTPNMGQGAGMAIEDAAVLTDCLTHYPEVDEAFRQFEQRRRQRASSIVKGSFQLGRVAQLTNPWLSTLRNTLFRMIPEQVSQRQMKSLYEVDLRH